MPRAIWNGKIIAESDETQIVEGNHYFPPNSIQPEYFEPSATTTRCGWKGTANYYTLNVDGKQNVDAAWFYADPKEAVDSIRGFVAFWKGVSIEGTTDSAEPQSGLSGKCDLTGD